MSDQRIQSLISTATRRPDGIRESTNYSVGHNPAPFHSRLIVSTSIHRVTPTAGHSEAGPAAIAFLPYAPKAALA